MLGSLRILVRGPVLLVWTVAIYVTFWLTRPTALISRRLAARTYHAVIRSWARGVARILGMRVTVEGRPPEAPFFLVSNHLSYLDIFVLLAYADCVMLSKAEVAQWPVFGFMARTSGTLFVDRTKKSDLPRVIETVKRTLAAGTGVIIFPEGTSSKGEEVLPFRASLFAIPVRTGTPVWYAALTYATPEDSPPAHLALCWWGDMAFLPHFLDVLRLRGCSAKVRFGDHPLVEEDRKRLSERAHEAVSSLFEPVVRPNGKTS